MSAREDRDLLDGLPEVVSADGADGVPMGPADLALSMGSPAGGAIPGSPRHSGASSRSMGSAVLAGAAAGASSPS